MTQAWWGGNQSTFGVGGGGVMRGVVGGVGGVGSAATDCIIYTDRVAKVDMGRASKGRSGLLF